MNNHRSKKLARSAESLMKIRLQILNLSDDIRKLAEELEKKRAEKEVLEKQAKYEVEFQRQIKLHEEKREAYSEWLSWRELQVEIDQMRENHVRNNESENGVSIRDISGGNIANSIKLFGTRYGVQKLGRNATHEDRSAHRQPGNGRGPGNHQAGMNL
ncbi:MAG: hypothetical protein H7829_06790 [Magnetococcus sp. THC-1_WYH]